MTEPLRLALMGGCGSSGTTLLTHLVSRHPQVASGPEFNCFNHIDLFDFARFKRRAYRAVAGRCDPSGYIDVSTFMTSREQYTLTTALILEWLQNADTLRDFLLAIQRHMLARYGASLFLEKSPTNVYTFHAFSRLFSEIPLIHVIRDGRDVAVSLMKREFNLFGAGSRWLYDTLCGLRSRDAPTYLEIRYEDLVFSPESVLQKIFYHIGVDDSVSVLSQHVSEQSGVYTEN
jgi:hypothetical protein